MPWLQAMARHWLNLVGGFVVVGDASAHDNGNTAELLFGYPLRQRSIEVVGMAGKPARELDGQTPGFAGGAAFFEIGGDFAHRRQNGGVFIGVAFSCRKPCLLHPRFFLGKVVFAMRDEGLQMAEQGIIF